LYLAFACLAATGWLCITLYVSAIPIVDNRRGSLFFSLTCAFAALAITLIPRPLDRKRPLTIAVALWLGTFGLLVSNSRSLTSEDNLPTRDLPVRLLSGRGLEYTELESRTALPYYLIRTEKGIQSAFPAGTGLLTLPFVAISKVVTPDLLGDSSAAQLEKALAAWLASASVGLLFLAINLRFGLRESLVVAGTYAAATPLVTSLGQGLWSSTGLALSATIMIAASFAPRANWANLVTTGLSASFLFLCRPSDVAVLAVIPAAAMGRHQAVRRITAAAVGLLTGVSINVLLTGSILGGYGLLNQAEVGFRLEGALGRLLGVLASPSRGVLVFLPWLPVCLVALFVQRRNSLSSRLGLGVGLAIATSTLITALYPKWWGGYSFGPRVLSGLSPLMAIAAIASTPEQQAPPILHRSRLTALIWTLIALSAIVEILGALRPVAWLWNDVADPDRNQEILWSLGAGQLAATVLPRWRFSPPAYSSRSPGAPYGEYDLWQKLDLSAHANARYDSRLFPEQELLDWTGAFPRLDPAKLNRPEALFHFLPLGQMNAVTLCGAIESIEIPLQTPGRLHAVHIVATMAAAGSISDGTSIATVRVLSAAGAIGRENQLISGRDVFDFDPDRRVNQPSLKWTYAGRPHQRDALLRVRILAETYKKTAARLVLSKSNQPGPLCLSVLAVTAEMR
jgi:hypothetical protein